MAKRYGYIVTMRVLSFTECGKNQPICTVPYLSVTNNQKPWQKQKPTPTKNNSKVPERYVSRFIVHQCVLVHMARINTTVPDDMKEWLEDQTHLNASGLLQKAIDEEMAKSIQVKETSSAERIAEFSSVDTFFRLVGYNTDSDVEAHLCCSECGARVALAGGGWNIEGGVCGCEEPPKEWKIEPVQED